MDDICEWIVKAGPKEDDEITSRYDPARVQYRKVVTTGQVNLGIKLVARDVGLPEKMFSSRSLRSGLTSQMAAMGGIRGGYTSSGWMVSYIK